MSPMNTYNKETLLEMLHCREVVVKFRKTNGDLREMRCTLDPMLLPGRPEDLEPKSPNEDVKPPRKQNPNVVNVWDLDTNEWRSFRTDRIIEVR